VLSVTLMLDFGVVWGDEAAVTLDSCRAWARENYPMSRQYGLLQKAAAYDISNASRMWIPRLVISAQGTWQSETTSMEDLWDVMGLDVEKIKPIMNAIGYTMPDLYMRPWQGKVQAELQQTIWDGGASKAKKDIARADAAAEAAENDVTMYEMENRLDNIYLGILLIEEQKRQMDGVVELLGRTKQNTVAMFENELVLQSDIDAVEVELLSAEQKKSQLDYVAKSYREMLSVLCGRDLRMAKLEVPMDKQYYDSVGLRPELRLLDAQNLRLQKREKALWVAATPQIGAFAQGWYGYPSMNMFKSMESSTWRLNAVVGLQLRWNIGAFYTISNDRKKIANGMEQIEARRETFNMNLQMQKREKQNEIERAAKALESDEKIVRLRRSVREAAEAKYSNGVIGMTELMKTVNDELQAECAMTIHKIEYIKAKIEYAK